MRRPQNPSLSGKLLVIALLGAGPSCDTASFPETAPDGERQPVGKADGHTQVPGTCFGHDETTLCGGPGQGGCWCDDKCEWFGDCCGDFAPACTAEPEPECNPEPLEVRDQVLSGDVVWDNCEVHLMLPKTTIGGSLTIAPGVHVFGDNEATPSSLLVKGTLLARGTPQQPIVFQPGAAVSSWGGIATGNYAESVTLEYVELREPTGGLTVHGGSVAVTHAVFDGTGVGSGVALSPYRPEVEVTLDDVLIREFGTGVYGWRVGGTNGADSELVVRNSVISANERGIFLGTDYEYCGNPEVARPRGFVRVENSDIVGNGLAFGVGYDERWTRYQLERLNIIDNGDIALLQPYEVPVASWVRDNNIVGNDGGLVTFRKLWGKSSFPENYWGGLEGEGLTALFRTECSGASVEDKFSFSGVRPEPVADAGPQHPEPWERVCIEAADPCS